MLLSDFFTPMLNSVTPFPACSKVFGALNLSWRLFNCCIFVSSGLSLGWSMVNGPLATNEQDWRILPICLDDLFVFKIVLLNTLYSIRRSPLAVKIGL